MSIGKADVVRSVQGRDRGERFYVVELEGDYVLVVNGRDRRLEKAKKKKLKHIELLHRGEGRVADKLRAGDRVTNGEIRRALASEPQLNEGQGGMHIGEG